MNQKISLVVPVYNEEENILEFVKRSRLTLDSVTDDWEMIFVNDGSEDNSEKIINDLRRVDERIRLLNLSRNFGKEAAMTAGIDYADGDAVVIIDADLQDPPELIPELIKKWHEGFDVVYATRKYRKGESWLKKTTAKVFYKTISLMTKIEIPQDTGDFRLLSKRAVKALRQLPEHHRFMKGLFSWIGFKQTGVLYEREPRYAGRTKWNYWKLWNFALEGITSFTYVPLQIAMYMGIIVAILSLCYAIFLVIRTLVWGRDVPGYASLMVSLLFLGGVELIGLGVIGEYLGRCYNESKRRPVYLLREPVNKYGDNP